VAQFKCGDFSTCDATRPGGPKTVTTPEIIDQIHDDIFIYLPFAFNVRINQAGRKRTGGGGVWRSLVTSIREWGEGTLADFINCLRGLRPAAEITSHPVMHSFLNANLWY
jgi:hypothetical protein